MSYFSYHILGVTDLLMVGQLGKEAIAAVGIALSLLWFLIVPLEGFFNSTLIFLSRFFGEKNFDGMRRYLRAEVFLALAGGTLLLLLYFPVSLCIPIFTSDPVVQELAERYFLISFFGLPLYAVNWVLTRFLLSVQKTKFIGFASHFVVLLNIFLNWGFIFGAMGFPQWGVAGSAVATLIARIVSLAIFAVYAIGVAGKLFGGGSSAKDVGPAEKKARAGEDKAVLREVFSIGTPMAVSNLVEIGGWIVFVALVSKLGTAALAIHEIALKIKDIAFLPGAAVAEINTNLVGESIGKKDPELAKAYCTDTLTIAMGVMGGIGVIFFIFADSLAGFFTQDPAVLSLSGGLLRIIALYQVFDAMLIVFRGALNGLKDIRFVRNVILVAWWLILLPLAWLFSAPLGWGVAGAWLAFLGFAVFAGLILGLRFYRLADRAISETYRLTHPQSREFGPGEKELDSQGPIV